MITLYWSPAYIASGNDFDTTQKSGWIMDSLARCPMREIEIAAPEPLSAADLAEIHDPAYIEAVRTGTPEELAESSGLRWDPGIWTSACAHAGGMVAAALHALRNGGVAGSLSSGQHHAGRAEGAGYCTFNGIALTAKRALAAGAARVLIIDLDAHGAGGTHDLIAGDDRIWQLDIAVNGFESYTPRRPNTHDYRMTPEGYLAALHERLQILAMGNERFDLCIYYAGMDPYQHCKIGGLPRMTREILEQREHIVFNWCRGRGIPTAFGIGGGYINHRFTRAELVDLHRLTLRAAVGPSTGRSRTPFCSRRVYPDG